METAKRRKSKLYKHSQQMLEHYINVSNKYRHNNNTTDLTL